MDSDSARLDLKPFIETVHTQHPGGPRKSFVMLARQRRNLVTAICAQSLQAMAAPDFRLWINAAEQNHLSRRTSADQDHTRSPLHDARDQRWNFGIRKRQTAIYIERC